MVLHVVSMEIKITIITKMVLMTMKMKKKLPKKLL